MEKSPRSATPARSGGNSLPPAQLRLPCGPRRPGKGACRGGGAARSRLCPRSFGLARNRHTLGTVCLKTTGTLKSRLPLFSGSPFSRQRQDGRRRPRPAGPASAGRRGRGQRRLAGPCGRRLQPGWKPGAQGTGAARRGTTAGRSWPCTRENCRYGPELRETGLWVGPSAPFPSSRPPQDHASALAVPAPARR